MGDISITRMQNLDYGQARSLYRRSASVEICCFFSPMYSVDLVASSHNNNNKKRKLNLLKHILRFEFHENAILQV